VLIYNLPLYLRAPAAVGVTKITTLEIPEFKWEENKGVIVGNTTSSVILRVRGCVSLAKEWRMQYAQFRGSITEYMVNHDQPAINGNG